MAQWLQLDDMLGVTSGVRCTTNGFKATRRVKHTYQRHLHVGCLPWSSSKQTPHSQHAIKMTTMMPCPAKAHGNT
jgi:hypothetical protein